MKIKISASFSGVIATGSYQNAKPGYAVEVEYDTKDFSEVESKTLEEIVKSRQQLLQKICYANFKHDEEVQTIDRINRERADMRFYEGVPSVTSIIGWDSDFFVSPEDLTQYASQGNIIHAQVEHYIKTGKWVEPKDIEGTWADIVILKRGSLHLPIEGWDFPAFLVKYPLEKMENGKKVKSCKHKFAGTSDIRKCYYEGLKTLSDVKRTPDKLKGFKQTAAYILAEEEMGESPYEQMMLIPLNDKTAQGYSKPIICKGRDKIKQYQDMFLRDREAFQKRYGV